jgi:hypothetical protein
MENLCNIISGDFIEDGGNMSLHISFSKVLFKKNGQEDIEFPPSGIFDSQNKIFEIPKNKDEFYYFFIDSEIRFAMGNKVKGHLIRSEDMHSEFKFSKYIPDNSDL